MSFILNSASVRGPGHICSDLPNQDFVLTQRSRTSWLAVVSDGMGSRRLSHIGSRVACRAVQAATKQCSFDTSDKELIQCIYQNWLHMLGEIKPNDAVATCLVAWGIASGECRLLQLGDGVIFFQTNTPGQLACRATNSFGNETTGLGISKKVSDWTCQKIELTHPSDGLVLMTDGISDDIENPSDFTHAVISTLRGKGVRYCKRWMTRELEAWPTPRHTDDKSIAVIYRK